MIEIPLRFKGELELPYCSAFIVPTCSEIFFVKLIMKLFVAVVKKNRNGHVGNINADMIETEVENAAELLFPTLNFKESVSRQKWVDVTESVWTYCFSNEPCSEKSSLGNQNLNIKSATYKLGHSDLEADELLQNSALRLDRLRHASGCFAFAHADNLGIDFITDAVNSHPIYFVETPSYTIAATRSNVVNYLIEKFDAEYKLDYDLLGCRDFALQGHFLGRRTGFSNVNCSGVHEHLRFSRYGLEISSWHKKSDNKIVVGSSEYDEIVSSIGNALIGAMRPLQGSTLHLSITGGRDSRLLAAALYNLDNIDVRTATSGTTDHPDVFLGSLIAEKLDWQHKVVQPNVQGKVVYAEDPLERVIRTLDVHDNSTSAWDDFPDYGIYSAKPTMSGVGGEILRGGMTLISRDSISGTEAEQIVRNTMCGGGFFNVDVQNAAVEYARKLRMQASYDPNGALDTYYHEHRNSRWVCNRRNGARTRWNVIDPLMDNRLVLLALDIQASDRWTERLVFDVISKLAPQLRDIPIEGERWRFERAGYPQGVQSDLSDSWHCRENIRATAQMHKFDWRRLQTDSVRKTVVELILDNLNGRCSELFDREKIEAYLSDIKYPTTTWHILTCVMLMNGKWRDHKRGKKNEGIEIVVQ